MTVIGLLLLVLGIVVVGSLGYWVVIKFFPAQVHMPALAIIGVLLLLVLLAVFFPNLSGIQVW